MSSLGKYSLGEKSCRSVVSQTLPGYRTAYACVLVMFCFFFIFGGGGMAEQYSCLFFSFFFYNFFRFKMKFIISELWLGGKKL